MRPLYVNCYTDRYADEAAALVQSLDQFGLDHRVERIEDAGTWAANCNLKPAHIERCAKDNPDRPIVWLDADARVRQYPRLFDDMAALNRWDFAAHWLNGSELLSGTLYFGPTIQARELVHRWRLACSRAANEWDQRTLQAVLPQFPSLRVSMLPFSYVRIFDYPGQTERPVIEHLQASRRLRDGK